MTLGKKSPDFSFKGVIILLVLFMQFLNAQSQPPQSVSEIGHIGGVVQQTVTQGDYTFLIQGAQLAVYELQAGQLVKVGSLALPALGYKLCLSGNYIIIAYRGGTYNNYFEIVDVSNPLNPQHISRTLFNEIENPITQLRADGDYLYFMTGTGLEDIKKVHFIDISNTQAPVYKGSYEKELNDFIPVGNYAYVIEKNTGNTQLNKLLVLNIANKSNVQQENSVDVPYARDLALDGTLLYCACENTGGLLVYDISAPTAPTIHSTFGTNNYSIRGILTGGNYAILKTSFTDFTLLDISVPTNIQHVTDYDFNQVFEMDYINNTYLYYRMNSTLNLLDLTNQQTPVKAAQILEPAVIRSQVIYNDVLYVAEMDDRVVIYDLNIPQQPVLIDTFQFNNPNKVFAHNNMLFLTDWVKNVSIYDISNLSNINFISTYECHSSVMDMAFWGDHAYILTYNFGGDQSYLDIVNISNPAAPYEEANLLLEGNGMDMALSDDGQYAYIAYNRDETQKGLQVINVSNPALPASVFQTATDYLPKSVLLTNHTLFLTHNQDQDNGPAKIDFYDVSAPAAPQFTSQYDLNISAAISDILLINNSVVMCLPSYGIATFDYDSETHNLTPGPGLQIPAPRQMAAYYPSPVLRSMRGKNPLPHTEEDVPWYLYVIKGYEYYAETLGKYGLNILEIEFPPSTPTPVLTVSVNALGGQDMCPPEADEKILIASGGFAAATGNWDIGSVRFEATGHAKASEVDSVVLEFRGKHSNGRLQVDTEGYITGIQANVGETLAEGETMTWVLYYFFLFPSKSDSSFMPCPLEDIREYGIALTGNYVNAEPQSNPPGQKDPVLPQKLYSPTTTIACVWNKSTNPDLPFPLIQPAINSPGTQNGHYISVCPGVYEENVTLPKSLKIKSTHGRDVTVVIPPPEESLNKVNDEPLYEHISFYVQRDSTEIAGFSVLSRELGGAGILLYGESVKDCIVHDNFVTNFAHGIRLEGRGVQRNKIYSNTVSRCFADGISVLYGNYNQIGSMRADADTSARRAGNICIDNNMAGIGLYDSRYNTVQYNMVGLDESGTSAIQNGYGIHLSYADSCLVRDNWVSGNEDEGIILNTGADSNRVVSNWVGVNMLGQTTANGTNGIDIRSSYNTIGGPNPEDKNYICGNGENGIYLSSGHDNIIINNQIGLYQIAANNEPNHSNGILMEQYTKANTIGSLDINIPPNIIAGNEENGVSINNSKNNKIYRNLIGMVDENRPIGNLDNGIRVIQHSDSTFIESNIISGNSKNGVNIYWSDHCLVKNNCIGTNKNGSEAVPNYKNGINVSMSDSTRIEFNVVSGNSEYGIFITASDYTKIIGNVVGADFFANYAIPNQKGISLLWGCDDNVIGSRILGERNIISGNNGHGLSISGGSENHIHLNYIGTQSDGLSDLGNTGVGIILRETNWNTIIQNKIMFNDSTGIHIETARSNRIYNNTIAHNCPGFIIINSPHHTWRNIERSNNVYENSGNSGFHLVNSTSDISGNRIINDLGDGIYCEKGSNPIIQYNSIHSNSGYDLINTDPSVSIEASLNWWGSASGPNANEIFGSADYTNWLEAEPEFIGSVEKDTLYISPGSQDSVALAFQNFKNLNGSVTINVSDENGWLTSPASFAVNYSDNMGAMVFVALKVQEGTTDGIQNKVFIEAIEQNTSHTFNDTLLVIASTPVLQSVAIFPDSVSISPGDSLYFYAVGYDQNNITMDIGVLWSATGGTIDSSGFYIAGEEYGTFYITATDTLTGIYATIQININITSVTENPGTDELLPKTFQLYQNYPNPFNPATTICFDVKEKCHVSLSVFDLLGRKIKTLLDNEKEPGSYKITFEAKDLPSGVYLYYIKMDRFEKTKKMIILK